MFHQKANYDRTYQLAIATFPRFDIKPERTGSKRMRCTEPLRTKVSDHSNKHMRVALRSQTHENNSSAQHSTNISNYLQTISNINRSKLCYRPASKFHVLVIRQNGKMQKRRKREDQLVCSIIMSALQTLIAQRKAFQSICGATALSSKTKAKILLRSMRRRSTIFRYCIALLGANCRCSQDSALKPC